VILGPKHIGVMTLTLTI